MKLILEISDKKYSFIMELLQSFSFVKKITPIDEEKEELKKDIQEAVKELKLVKAGKINAKDARDLLNEL